MKLIVAGGRSFKNYGILCEKIDLLTVNHKIESIICGGAIGADSLGKKYALEKGINVEYFIPDWDLYGKSARETLLKTQKKLKSIGMTEYEFNNVVDYLNGM